MKSLKWYVLMLLATLMGVPAVTFAAQVFDTGAALESSYACLSGGCHEKNTKLVSEYAKSPMTHVLVKCNTCHGTHTAAELGKPKPNLTGYYDGIGATGYVVGKDRCTICHTATLQRSGHPYNPSQCTGCHIPHIFAAGLPGLPGTNQAVLNGFWPGAGPVNTVVFLFGKYFKTADGTQPIVRFNGIPTYLTQVVSDDMILTLVPAGDTTGPITVETLIGWPPATSATSFGITPTALGINGLWPSEGRVGNFVFVFGSGFIPLKTQVKINAISAPLVQVMDAGLLIFQIPAGASSGLVSVTTTGGTASSATTLLVLPSF